MSEKGIIAMKADKAKLMNGCFQNQTEGYVKLTTSTDTRMIIDLEVKAKEYADDVHRWKACNREVERLKSNLQTEESKLLQLKTKMDESQKELKELVEAEANDKS